MGDTKNGAESDPKASDESEDDESEVLEESPCGRWLKRREEVRKWRQNFAQIIVYSN